MWLVNYAISKAKNLGEIIDYEAFLKTVLSEDPAPKAKPTKERSAEDIMAELMPIVQADKKKGG